MADDDTTTDDDDATDDDAATDTDDTSTDDAPKAPADDAPEKDWKEYARLWEKRAKRGNNDAAAKRERKKREAVEAKLRQRDDADKSEQEKAIEAARKEAREEALGEAEKDRRSDRLEVAVTRLAAKGVKVGDDDDAETVRFADPEDALLHLERAIDRGDVDEDDIYNENGRPNADAVTDALADLLTAKPHLRATGNGGAATGRKGRSDAGRGKGASKTAADMSVGELDALVRKGR